MKAMFLACVIGLVVFSTVMGGFSTPAADSFSPASPIILTKGLTETWGSAGNDLVANSSHDSSGNLYLAGTFVGTVDFDPDPVNTEWHSSANNTTDAFLSKYDANGTFLWAKTWGGGGGATSRDTATGMVIDDAGNIYVSGSFQNTVDFNPDPAATEIHTSNSGDSNNIYISKFASDGAFQWVRAWGPADGGAESYGLAKDASNNIYAVGDFSGTNTNFNPWDAEHPDWHTNHPPVSGPVFFDAFLVKFSSSGAFQWAKTWGGEGYDDGPGVAVDGLGNIYVAGMYASLNIDFDPAGSGVTNHPAHDSGPVVDVFLSKFNSNGEFQWVKTWGGQGVEDAGLIVKTDGDNNVYFSGRFACTNCDFNPGGTPSIHSSNGNLDVFIMKYDAAGNFLWAKTWGGTGWDAACAVKLDGNEHVYIAGFFVDTVNFDPEDSQMVTSNGLRDVFFTELSPDGRIISTKTWGGTGNDMGFSLTVGNGGKVYVVGSFSNTVDFDPGTTVENHSANGGTDAFLSQFIPLDLSYIIYLPQVVDP